MRAFLAAPADPAWVESAGRMVAGLRRALPKASWAPAGAWHLTLRFLGEVPPALGEVVAREVARAAEGVGPLLLEPGGPVVFPSRGRARVLGVGFAPSPDLEALGSLAAAAEASARRAGLAPEVRPFRPHVTLARLREAWTDEAVESFRREVSAWDAPVWTVRSCVLYESRLDPAGAVHVPRSTIDLAGARQEVVA